MRYLLALLLVLCSVPAFAAGPGNTDLAWTNSDPVALGVLVERHDGLCGVGTFIELPASKTTGTMKTTKDLTTTAGREYCYRIAFWNTTIIGGTVVQKGPYSSEVGIAFPLVQPTAGPSGVTVQ
jgi:hypothetical protein